MPKLSVCITHFGRGHLLGRTLESLACQTRLPDEVLVWDDHSPEDPHSIVSRFQSRFPRLIYHRNPVNLGMPGNLNAVIAAAGGDLIANLHDADEFDPRLLELWERALLEHPSAGLVFCRLDMKRFPGGDWRMAEGDFLPLTPGRVFFESVYVGASGSPIWGTVMARREVYARHLPFDARFGPWADVDMWMRICATHDIAHVPLRLIAVDHSPTAFRAFSFETVRLIHSIYFVNIRRMARSSSELSRWIARQRLHLVKEVAVIALGSLCRLNFVRAAEAVLMTPDWIGLMSGETGTEASIPSHPLCRSV